MEACLCDVGTTAQGIGLAQCRTEMWSFQRTIRPCDSYRASEGSARHTD
uniref:Uncharacterized protein n=1 Tax=Anguilla anguilla TaxID=7936 RepID=A0A0E9PRF6_ANGAN